MQSGFTKNLRSLKRRSLLGQLVAAFLSCEILFFASFISLSLPTPTLKNLQHYVLSSSISFARRLPPGWQEKINERLPCLTLPAETVRFSSYVPVLPAAIAVSYTLGLPLAVISLSLYLLLGLSGQVQGLYLFASGGGMNYWREPGFGYYLGIIFGGWFAARITECEERKSWRQLLAGTGGVIIAHLVGLACFLGGCLTVLLLEGESAYLQYQPWLSAQIRNMSWYTLPYDLLFATMVLALSFPLRWLFAVLTSPDMANRHRPAIDTQLEMLQESTV